jgi:hypothetical protein
MVAGRLDDDSRPFYLFLNRPFGRARFARIGLSWRGKVPATGLKRVASADEMNETMDTTRIETRLFAP